MGLELELTNSSSKTGFTCTTEILGFGPPLLPVYTETHYHQDDLSMNDLNVIPQLAQMGIDRLDQAKRARNSVPETSFLPATILQQQGGLENVTYAKGNLRGNRTKFVHSAPFGN